MTRCNKSINLPRRATQPYSEPSSSAIRVYRVQLHSGETECAHKQQLRTIEANRIDRIPQYIQCTWQIIEQHPLRDSSISFPPLGSFRSGKEAMPDFTMIGRLTKRIESLGYCCV
jgi:hypothetical protein